MKETINPTSDSFLKNFKKADDIIEQLKKGPINTYSEEVVFYGEEVAKNGSDVISRFYSVHSNKLYYGYENFDRINRVASLFNQKKYREAYEETGCESIKYFVEAEREIISDLKEYATLDLHELSNYNEAVGKALSDISKFIKENNLQQYKGDDFRSSVMKGKLDELHEIQESLFNIKTTIEVAINFAVEGKRSLTLTSDGILQNIAMISAVGDEEAQRAWNGDYPQEVDVPVIKPKKTSIREWGNILFGLCCALVPSFIAARDGYAIGKEASAVFGMLIFISFVMLIYSLSGEWKGVREKKTRKYKNKSLVQEMINAGTENDDGSVSIPLDDEMLIFNMKQSYHNKIIMMITRKGNRSKEIMAKDITDHGTNQLMNVRSKLFEDILADQGDGFRSLTIEQAHSEVMKNGGTEGPNHIEYMFPTHIEIDRPHVVRAKVDRFRKE